ncbi:MAG: YHYH protein [Acidimicrobiia bacterium]|nr:YHYH protein [Acidimicrobiia bacterium]
MKTKLLTRIRRVQVASLVLAFLLLLSACGSGDSSTTTDGSGDTTVTSTAETMSSSGVDVGLFFDGALAEDATTEACILSDGTETTCYRITVAGDPVTYETGPFCPETIADSADAGGIWFDGNGVYDIDGDFIVGLADLYDDDNWMMYDEDGNVLVTETLEEFEAAARPDVDPALQNHCVEGRLEWLEGGEPISTTVLIPVEPVLADSASTTNGNLGVTLDGVVIAASAPVDAILAAYTIAAFDDCGGHYNPFDGYHLHGAVGCSELDEISEGDTAMFAYAMDGFPVFSPLHDADAFDLDECNGHETEEHGYHYHANGAEENQVIECLIGKTVAGAEGPGGGPPAGGGG